MRWTHDQTGLVGSYDKATDFCRDEFGLEDGHEGEFHADVDVCEDTTDQHLFADLGGDEDGGGDERPAGHDHDALLAAEAVADHAAGDQAEHEAHVGEAVEEREEVCFDDIDAAGFVEMAKLLVEGGHGLRVVEGGLVHAKVDLRQCNEGARVEEAAVEG